MSQTVNPNELPPVATDPHHKAPLGLRTVAIFELAKGVVVLVVGLYLLSLVHKDVEASATSLIHLVRLDPAWHISQWLLETAGQVTDQQLRQFALIAVGYCVVRIVEAYGLWHELHWAEWFAAISAGLFLPVEVYHIIKHPTFLKGIFFIGNVLVVLYLCHILAVNHRRKMALKNHQPQPEPAKF